MPTMVQAGMYSAATLHYLKAVEAAGTLDTAAVLSKIPFDARERLLLGEGLTFARTACTSTTTTCCGQRRWSSPRAPWDFYDVVATVPAEDANIPREQSKCSLMKKS